MSTGARDGAADRRRPYRFERWGIINPSGEIWSRNTFDTPKECAAYVKAFWPNRPSEELAWFKAVLVSVVITHIPVKDGE